MGLFEMEAIATLKVAEAPPSAATRRDPPPWPPIPCLVCSSPLAWVSQYDDEIRCYECDEPPASGLVRFRLALVLVQSGDSGEAATVAAWERHPANRWTPGLAELVGGGDGGAAGGGDSDGDTTARGNSHQLTGDSAAVAAVDLAVTLAELLPAELLRYQSRLAERRQAGEPEPGIEWRALVDVRIEFGHWRTAEALKENPKC